VELLDERLELAHSLADLVALRLQEITHRKSLSVCWITGSGVVVTHAQNP
jgi:hypothetical protein